MNDQKLISTTTQNLEIVRDYQSQFLQSLTYAKYKGTHWGRFLWSILFCIALFIDTLPTTTVRAKYWIIVYTFFQSILQYILPCGSCSRHYIKYWKNTNFKAYWNESNNNAFGVTRWCYDLKRSIDYRLFKKVWKRHLQAPRMVRYALLRRYLAKAYTFDETVQYYRKMSMNQIICHTVSFIHILALTYPDAYVEALNVKGPTSQQRRLVIQQFLTIYLFRLVPLPQKWMSTWVKMAKDIRVWINSSSLLISLYQSLNDAGYLQKGQSLDGLIMKCHQCLLPMKSEKHGPLLKRVFPSSKSQCDCAGHPIVTTKQ